MKKLLLFVIACTLGLFTVNAQNRLESITKAYEGDNITYVYASETSNEVVKVLKGVDQGYGQYTTFLTYENGLLKSTEYAFVDADATINDIDKTSYSAEWDVVEYTYSEGRLASYKELQYRNWYSSTEPQSETEYTLVYDGDKVTSITFGTSKITYTYENGKLVQEEKSYYDQWATPPGDVVDYSIEYIYDEAGNCVSATKYTHYNGKTPSETTEYVYDVTKLATDVYSFAYPYEVKPVNVNIITKASTYGYYADWFYNEETDEWEQGEPTKGEATVATYNYSFATISAPVAPTGLTAEVLSDTEVKLMWDVVADATSYNVYNGTELVAENVTETTYTVNGLTAATEYTFTVTAVNEGGESAASNEAKVTTLKAIEINFEAIAFGEVTVGGEYWSKVGATKDVKVTPFGKEVKSITVDNAFFTLPEIDLTAETITFAVGYDVNAAAGEYEGNLVVTLATDATYTVPMTATAYAPVTPDVFELAQEITFTDGVYTNTPDFATLHDNYLGAPDAVYTFTLEDNEAVEVTVTGENAKHAIYAEGDFTTSLQRTEKILSTTFSYDFNDGNLDDFIVVDNDEFDYTWELEEDDTDGYELVSYSFLGAYEGDQWVIYVQEADERIITKEAYPLTQNSVLALDIDVDGKVWEEIFVEVTTDGENFTELAKVADDEYTYSEDWIAKKVNIGAKLAEAGLEFGEYQIALRHNYQGGGRFAVDNLSLTERGLVYPAGKYFLVAAAETEFSVEVKSVVYTGTEVVDVPAAPVVEATANVNAIVLTWAAVETATSYNVYQGEEKLANVTELTYTVEGLDFETEYCFTVTAVNENGESKATEACATTEKDPDAPVVEVLLFEDFESYEAGNQIAKDGAEYWTTWSKKVGGATDGVVAEKDGNKYGHLTHGVDQVLLLGGYQSGVFDLEFDMYIPAEKVAYYNLLHEFNGSNSEWAMQAYIHLTDNGQSNPQYAQGHGTLHAGSNSTADVPCVHDGWMHFRVHIDANTDKAEYYYTMPGEEEQKACEWTWSLESFGGSTVGRKLDAMNFYPLNANSEYYIDNISLTRIGGEAEIAIGFDTDKVECNLDADDMNTVEFVVENTGNSIVDYTAWVDYGEGAMSDAYESVTYSLEDLSNATVYGWTTDQPLTFEVAALYPSSAYATSLMGTYLSEVTYLLPELIDPQTGESLPSIEPGTGLTFRVYEQGINGVPGKVLAEKVIPAEDVVFDWNVATFDEPVALTGFDFYIAVEMTQALDGSTMTLDGNDKATTAGFGDLFRQSSGAFMSFTEVAKVNEGSWTLVALCEGNPVIGGWAELDKKSGSLAIGAKETINVEFSSFYLEPGKTYDAKIVFNSTASEESIELPVSLYVFPEDVEEILSNTYNIYPNPTAAQVTVEGENINYIAVYNSVGQLVKVVRTQNNVVDMSANDNGVYFFNIVDNAGQSSVQRVVVAK